MIDQPQDVFTTAGLIKECKDRLNKLQHFVAIRAVAYGDDPAGSTGLYKRRFKIVGREYPLVVVEHILDRSLLRIESATRKQLLKLIRDFEKVEGSRLSTEEFMRRLDAGRERAAKAHAERVATEAAAKGEQQPEPKTDDVPPITPDPCSGKLGD